jgi:hypothetical protein
MTTKPRIAIVIGSTRPGRYADKAAGWMLKQTKARDDMPTPTTTRGSTRCISRGTSGISSSCGRPVQASTMPICSEL